MSRKTTTHSIYKVNAQDAISHAKLYQRKRKPKTERNEKTAFIITLIALFALLLATSYADTLAGVYPSA